MIDGVLLGLQTALSFNNLMMVVAGCLIGTFIGMLPGLGPMSIIAIMIPVAIKIGDPSSALILLAGVYYGAIFGGSTSSILINAPGVASTVATSFDGYPMARAGLGGRALAIAAYASFAGGTLGVLALMLFAASLAALALEFQSPDQVYFPYPILASRVQIAPVYRDHFREVNLLQSSAPGFESPPYSGIDHFQILHKPDRHARVAFFGFE